MEIETAANKKSNNDETSETITKQLSEESSASGTTAKIVKPRALVFRAQNKDFCQIVELIKTQFPDVEVLYMTTAPARGILKVTKSMPLAADNQSVFFSVE